jgi:hypothetical protein
MRRLAKHEVELGSLQLEVKQGHQDIARKVNWLLGTCHCRFYSPLQQRYPGWSITIKLP